jgi:hypothetical protein
MSYLLITSSSSSNSSEASNAVEKKQATSGTHVMEKYGTTFKKIITA